MPTFLATITDKIEFTKEVEAHLRVQRIQPGEVIRVTNGQQVFEGRMIQTKGNYRAEILREINSPKPPRPFYLHISLLKRDTLEWIVEKAVELNITAVHLIQSGRSVRGDISLKQMERFKKIAGSAQTQCGRIISLEIYPPKSFQQSMEENLEGRHFFCHPDGDEMKPSENIPGLIHAWIGPEGGWDPQEIELAQRMKCEFIRFGDLILRSETACIYLMSRL